MSRGRAFVIIQLEDDEFEVWANSGNGIFDTFMARCLSKEDAVVVATAFAASEDSEESE